MDDKTPIFLASHIHGVPILLEMKSVAHETLI